MKCTRKKIVNTYPTIVILPVFSFFINCNGITCQEVFLIPIIRRWKFVGNWLASAHTARREEEPVHEDTFAIVIRVVGEQSVPFILLLAATVTGAPIRLGFRANFLVNGLLKMLRVHDGTNLSSTVACPIGRYYLHLGLACIDSAAVLMILSRRLSRISSFPHIGEK